MNKLTRINVDRAAAIQAASGDTIRFKSIDGTLKGVTFPTPLGDVTVEIDSYSVVFSQAAKKKVHTLSFFAKVADQKFFVEKQFDNSHDREMFICEHLSDVARDELTLGEAEVDDN